MAMDKETAQRLKNLAREHLPSAYRVLPAEPIYQLLSKAFKHDPMLSALLLRSETDIPEGVIIFGYENDRGMKPITDILLEEKITYGSVDVAGGRKIYFMSHADARNKLPPPGLPELDNHLYNNTPGKFDQELEVALNKAKIEMGSESLSTHHIIDRR